MAFARPQRRPFGLMAARYGLAYLLGALASAPTLADDGQAGRPLSASTPSSPTLDPAHTFSFEAANVGGAAVAPDGSTVYIHLRLDVVNAWAVLVHHWPECLGAVALLCLLIVLTLTRRIRSRPRASGRLYCRRCNYDLVAHIDRDTMRRPVSGGVSRCPECGSALSRHRVVVGRTCRRRLLCAAGPFVLLIVCYLGMHAARLPRDGSAHGWVDWASTDLARWNWLRTWRTPGDRIVAVDLPAGDHVRTVCTRSTQTWFCIEVTPDGESLFLSDGTDRVARVSTRSGRELASVEIPGVAGHGTQWPSIHGFSPDGRTAFVSSVDERTAKSRLLAWHLDDNRFDVVVEEDAYQNVVRGGTVRSELRRYALLAEADDPPVLSAPDFSEAYETRAYVVRIYGRGSGGRRLIELPAIAAPMGDPIVAPNGDRLFVSAVHRGVIEVDLANPRNVRTIRRRPRFAMFGDRLAIDPSGRWLFTSLIAESMIAARDLESDEWAFGLRHREALMVWRMFVSRDRRWLAVDAHFKRPDGSFGSELLLYDLTEAIDHR